MLDKCTDVNPKMEMKSITIIPSTVFYHSCYLDHSEMVWTLYFNIIDNNYLSRMSSGKVQILLQYFLKIDPVNIGYV